MNSETFVLSKHPSFHPCRRSLPLWLAAFAALGFLAPIAEAQTPVLVLSNKWSLAAGSHWDLDTGNLTRGVAINKLTGNVLLASRVSSNHVSVISGVDGSDLGTLNSTGISGGTLPLDLVGVADDGVIYAAKLSASSASILKIYRWDSEADGMTNPPITAFSASPAPTPRYGDSMDIRGAGTNTQIIMSGSSSTAFGVFTTTDGTNFTLTEIPLSGAGLAAGELAKGITFEGTNNNCYGKKDGSTTLHKLSFNLGTMTSALITNITLTGDANTVGTKYGKSNSVEFISAVLSSSSATTNATSHRMKVYTVNNPSAPVTSGDFATPQPYTGNGNIVGSSDIGNGMVVGIDVNSGMIALAISFKTNVPPSIVTQPQDQTNVLSGGYVTFSVSASGSTPLSYQWKFNDTNTLAGATNSALTVTNLQATNAGLYSCRVTNAAGSTNSANATLTLLPSVLTAAEVPLWAKSVGDLFFLSNDNSQRGLAYNPMTGHLIVVSRFPSNGVHVLEANNGNYVTSLDMSSVTGGGTFLVNLSGAGDDGAIYVANLDTAGSSYEIYRWSDELAGTVATVAYGPGDPCGCGRLGDTMAVRGGGTNTQILIGSRNGAEVVVFTTTDGTTFSPNVITTDQPVGLAGLGIAFGAGDTFWTKSSGFQFRHIVFDLANATNGLLQTFTAGYATSCALAVDPVNDLVVGMVPNTGTRPIPDNLELYDVHAVVTGAADEPALIDQDFFKTSNPNLNGTGAAVFDVNSGRLFALDSNNGLLALKVVARLFPHGTRPVLTWTGPSALQSSTNVVGPYSDIGGATSPYTNLTSRAASFFRLRR